MAVVEPVAAAEWRRAARALARPLAGAAAAGLAGAGEPAADRGGTGGAATVGTTGLSVWLRRLAKADGLASRPGSYPASAGPVQEGGRGTETFDRLKRAASSFLFKLGVGARQTFSLKTWTGNGGGNYEIDSMFGVLFSNLANPFFYY